MGWGSRRRWFRIPICARRMNGMSRSWRRLWGMHAWSVTSCGGARRVEGTLRRIVSTWSRVVATFPFSMLRRRWATIPSSVLLYRARSWVIVGVNSRRSLSRSSAWLSRADLLTSASDPYLGMEVRKGSIPMYMRNLPKSWYTVAWWGWSPLALTCKGSGRLTAKFEWGAEGSQKVWPLRS